MDIRGVSNWINQISKTKPLAPIDVLGSSTGLRAYLITIIPTPTVLNGFDNKEFRTKYDKQLELFTKIKLIENISNFDENIKKKLYNLYMSKTYAAISNSIFNYILYIPIIQNFKTLMNTQFNEINQQNIIILLCSIVLNNLPSIDALIIQISELKNKQQLKELILKNLLEANMISRLTKKVQDQITNEEEETSITFNSPNINASPKMIERVAPEVPFK